jgi:ethanolamine utilization protein EutJ
VNPNLESYLTKAHAVIAGEGVPAPGGRMPASNTALHIIPATDRRTPLQTLEPDGAPPQVHVGVDLGTAYTVLVVLDAHFEPLAGAFRFAQVVRDGLVVDFHGAIHLLQELKHQVEKRLGFELVSAATAFPPGVPPSEVRATQHVVRAAGFECEQVIDEPTAANALLQVKDGAVVDVGGGTTGIAVFRDGKVVYTADEPTGGTHFSLVIAGALNMEFEDAENYKKNTANQQRLYPIVRPVMEKVGAIVARHVAAHKVSAIYLVGGTACFPGIDRVVEEVTGIRTAIPGYPLFVTPLGTAMYNTAEIKEVRYGR